MYQNAHYDTCRRQKKTICHEAFLEVLETELCSGHSRFWSFRKMPRASKCELHTWILRSAPYLKHHFVFGGRKAWNVDIHKHKIKQVTFFFKDNEALEVHILTKAVTKSNLWRWTVRMSSYGLPALQSRAGRAWKIPVMFPLCSFARVSRCDFVACSGTKVDQKKD